MEEEIFPRGGVERVQKEVKETTEQTKKNRKRANSKDFLFGSKETKSKKSKKTKDSTKSAVVASSSLPLGGGAVLQPTQSGSVKKPAFIEAISFQKLAKGTKLIGIVKNVASEYAVVSLPSMLTGFVRYDAKSGIPLNRVLSVGQFLPVVVVKATSETVKAIDGSSSQMKRRIELSVSPASLNSGLSTDMLHEGMSIRGKIRSVEDHGCIIDLNIIGLGGSSCFLKFENVKGKYCILNDEDEENDEECDDIDFKLNDGRIYDFTIKSLPQQSKKESSSSIIQLALENNKCRSTHISDAATHLASKHSIRTLSPGMLLQVDVEHFARNGLCVSILGNVYRGAIDSAHLGGYLPDDTEENQIMKKVNTAEMWWKNVFVGKNRSVTARLIVVDPVTKIIRLSLLPHILSMEPPAEDSFPSVGSVVENARVVRLDSGVGALLALPNSDTSMDIDEEGASDLRDNPVYKAASKVRCAYVHISKAIDSNGERTPEVLFAKKFAINKIIPKLRILSNGNWVDNVVTCATSESIVSSAILVHDDLQPGAIYKRVPVIANLDGGGILVELGSMGIKGLIPAAHVFDKATSNDGSFRNKIRMEKYKIGKKVDVRCLVADSQERKCTVTAKKSLLDSDIEDPITDYSKIVAGRIATGFVSSVNKKGIAITFYNNVFGRISARKLAEEVGVEDPTVDYNVGDVLKVKVTKCIEKDEEKRSYILDLSLDISGTSKDATMGEVDVSNTQSELVGLLTPGMIIPPKSMKIVEFVPSKRLDGVDGFIPGHVLVSLKSKYVSDEQYTKGSIACKLPFEQIFDSYETEAAESPEALDALAHKVLKVGKKIAQEGIILATKSGKGSPITPIISLKSILIETSRKNEGGNRKGSKQIILPAPKTPLYMGAYVQGFCARIDSRYGAFIRFLDNLTAIVPKLKGGLDIGLYDTVLCKIVAMDVTSGKAPKILLKRVSSTAKETQHQVASNTLVDTIKPGDLLGDIRIDSVNFARAAVTLLDKKFEGFRVKARVHVTMADPAKGSHEYMPIQLDSGGEPRSHSQQVDKLTEHHVFHSWKIGGIIKNTRCIAIDVRNGVSYIELTNRAKDNEEAAEMPTLVEDPSQLESGSTVSAVITAVSKQNSGIWVQVSPGCTGFIPGLEVSEDVNVLNNMKKHFKIGGRIKCTVLPPQSGQFKQVVRLSALSGKVLPKPVRGDIRIGRVNRRIHQVRAPSLMIELPGSYVGRCDITELEEPDDWGNMPLGRVVSNQEKTEDEEKRDQQLEGDFHHGLYVSCRILSNSGSGAAEVSLRESRLDGDLDNDAAPEEKEITHAFVVNTNKKGCFLRLSRFVEGRVILKELSDSFLPDPGSMFPPGRLVVGKVKKISTSKNSKKSKKSKITVDLDLRESVLLEDQDKVSFDDIKEGVKYGGVVTRIESYGVFVRLENSEVSGLVHLSECSDDYVKSLSSMYDPGDLVKVLVIKVDKEEKRIGLSMKASHFEDDNSEDDSVASDSDDSDEEDAADVKFVDDSDSDDENYASKLASKMQELANDSNPKANSSDSSEDELSSDGYSTDGSESESDDDEAPEAMDTDVGFNWGNNDGQGTLDSESDSSHESESEDEDDAKKGHKSRKKATAKKQEEKDIAKMEQRLADGTADENPETTADFERLLASDPNSSENWIKFMAYHLSLADIESARMIANRAFDRIEFRQEGEKLNVWTALITLESKYGTSKSFNDAIERAAQHNNPKQVYLRVCEMLDKDVSNSHGDMTAINRADEMFTKMCKKFKSKKTVWIAYFRYLLKNGRHEEAHKVWKRSVKSLPDYKHIETMSKLAQLEYEYGSAERARTVFDELLDKNRKRMDLLFVYIDKEVKHGEIEAARKIFERVLNPPAGTKKTKFNDKQMKSLFKKWYRIEDDNGDDESRLRVKMAAKDYVESSSK